MVGRLTGSSPAGRRRPWGPLCGGVVHWHKSPSAPCWPGLDLLSLAHGGMFQHSPALCSGLEPQRRLMPSPHTLQHPSTSPRHLPVPASQSGFGRIPCCCCTNLSLPAGPPVLPILVFAESPNSQLWNSELLPPGHHRGVSLCPHTLPSEPAPHNAHSHCPLTCAGFSCSLRFCNHQEPALSLPSAAQRMQNSLASVFGFGGRA